MSDKIPGWLSPDVATAMQCLIRETKPNLMVEIGVFAGKSLINAALTLRENGRGVIYGIDPWSMDLALANMGTGENVGFWNGIDLDRIHTECVHHIADEKLENVVLIRAPSERCHQLFQRESIDILYVDGGHSEQQSCSDVLNYAPKVKRNGWIWIDDTDWISVQKAAKMLDEHCELTADFGHACLYRKN